MVAPGSWEDRKLVRRVWRVTRHDPRQVLKEHHLQEARREDLERLARFVGLHPRASWSHEKLARRTWRLVDSRRPGS